MPDRRHFILGTAGHIDHGKSALVTALTGVDPDRLPEEKERGMTIELGFAHLTQPASDDSGDEIVVGVVDVPGHADFVKNMVAGVGSIDLALLIVAADDGWMPQTEEHYQILRYLRVPHAIVVLTKCDLSDDIELVMEDIRENLEGGPWAELPVIRTSSVDGTGIEQLKAEIARICTESMPAADVGKPRLPVDRAFSLKGVGTVVTGTLIDGTVATGDDLVIQPVGLRAGARSVQSHQSDQESARPHMRTALNLGGISLARRGVEGVSRGDVITNAALGSPVRVIDVLVEKCDREIRGQKHSKRAMKSGRKVLFHYGSGSHIGRIHFLAEDTLEPGDSVIAELRFDAPVYVFLGDRFVLRDPSQGFTLAGGVVLDEDANPRIFRKPWQAEFLRSRASTPNDLETLITSQVIRDKAVQRGTLLVKSCFSEGTIAEAVDRLISAEAMVARGAWVFDSDWWNRVSGTAAELIRKHHVSHPDLPGLPVRELRSGMTDELPDEGLFDVMVEGLKVDGFEKAGPVIRHHDHRPSLPPELEQVGARIRQILVVDPISPPNRAEIAGTPTDEKALRFLIQVGEAIELNPKTVISRAGYERIRALVVKQLQASGKASASDLRKVTGTSRRILLPTLERFDQEGVTVRDGDYRRLADRS
ncbi:MAG: selenocysteine-specific translation elongation factor [Verrucomicrobiota bacterium]